MRIVIFFSLCLFIACSKPIVPKISPYGDFDQGLTIAFGSCIDNPVSPIWSVIKERGPDITLLLGDNIYLKPDQWWSDRAIRGKYQSLLAQPQLKELLSSSQLAAIWDDHDFGPNNSDGTFRHKHITRNVFREFFRQGYSAIPNLEESTAAERTVGPVQILLTDNRWYRKKPSSIERGHYFGDLQLEWLISRLKHPSTPIIIIASGGQLLSRGQSTESFALYENESEALIEAMLSSPAKVILLSGDRHYAEVAMREFEGKRVYEVTSSPLTAWPRNTLPADQDTFSRRAPLVIGSFLGQNNFGFLKIKSDPQRLNFWISIELISVNRTKLLEHTDPGPVPFLRPLSVARP